MDVKKKIQKFFKHVFVRKQNHRAWIVSAAVLFVVFAGLAVLSFYPDLLRGGQQQNGSGKLFKLPVTVLYNQSSEEQKSKMEKFLANLSDPTTALKDTELQTKWLVSKSPEAVALLAQSKLHYLPQIFLDKSVEQHPQFDKLKDYLNKQGDFYFMRLAPLETLQVPDVTKGHVAGLDPAKAKVVVQVYESYLCDHCATAQDALKKVLKNYPDSVSIVYKHFEPEAIYNQLAQGAECAADQKKFTQMQDAIFKGQEAMLTKLQALTDEKDASAYVRKQSETYAKSLGLNLKTFQSCLDQKTYAKAIDDQTLDAIDYGINGPPAFFINKTFRNGLLSYDELKTLIDEQLKK